MDGTFLSILMDGTFLCILMDGAQANLTHICNTSPHFALVVFRRNNSLPNKFLSKADVYKNKLVPPSQV
jgi:hypothetical protein